ncbi:peptidase C39 [Acinetobacter sp. 194]|uniref:cysteine peptidase family C39 domain-containing protein n=1 Tax=Acinetobacter shaoyimingii TaxID=2715164 RepID=UPI00140B9ED2|nr:cysteine peptidase family C39 domain-containing protein [Acinetobacter shaoyimingii]NHB56449.1 peptidase C39 [Acinetobacter shaoyimingii]
MGLEIPEQLQNLNANCGLYAVWMILQHCDIELDIQDLANVCNYDPENGTFTIGLAVGLKKMGFKVVFHTEDDLHKDPRELPSYAEAERLQIPIHEPLSYADIQHAIETGHWVIVYYDLLDGVGNHSLVYDINDQEISFFDHFDVMTPEVFQQQRQAEGICQQAIVISREFSAL